MKYVEAQNEQATAGQRGDRGLALGEQIRIELDKDIYGDITRINLSNALACAMSEYSITIKFLENIPIYHRVRPQVLDFIRGLKSGLGHIERWRDQHAGIPYQAGLPYRWAGMVHEGPQLS